MTAKEMSNIIGKTGMFHENGLKFRVKINDVRTSYGRIHYLISPVCGDGEKWVDFSRVMTIS